MQMDVQGATSGGGGGCARTCTRALCTLGYSGAGQKAPAEFYGSAAHSGFNDVAELQSLTQFRRSSNAFPENPLGSTVRLLRIGCLTETVDPDGGY